MNAGDREIVRGAVAQWADGLAISAAECGCDCEECDFVTASVDVTGQEIEFLVDELQRVGFSIREDGIVEACVEVCRMEGHPGHEAPR